MEGPTLRWPALVRTIAVATLLLVSASPAHAEHDDFIDPDNVDHYVDRHDLTSQGSNATVHAIDQINRTKMNATLTGSGDVDVYDAYFGSSGSWSNILGRTTCVDRTWTGLECNIYEVRYNLTYMSGRSTANWNSLGCHEFGHTAGLGHRYASTDTDDNSCMRAEVDPQYFDTHDINKINEDV